MSSSKNLEYKKTSFLSKSNSAFIEQMYLKFINRDSDLPESWKKYFIEIGEEFEVVAKEKIKKMEDCGITIAKSPAEIGKTLLNKLSN